MLLKNVIIVLNIGMFQNQQHKINKIHILNHIKFKIIFYAILDMEFLKLAQIKVNQHILKLGFMMPITKIML